MKDLRPFTQGSFEALPDSPRLPHAYNDSVGHDVAVCTPRMGDVRAHVRVIGQGPPLLLVHGLMTSSYSFRYVMGPLSKRFTLYVPDLPGAGRSAWVPEAPFDPAAMAEWLVELQRALGIRGERVLGNSMGGYLCMHMALSDPACMSSLVNIHSPGVPEPRLYALSAALRMPGVAAGLAAYVQRAPLRFAHKNVHYWDESLKSLEEARAYGAPLGDPQGAKCFVKFLRETMAIRHIRAFYSILQERHRRGEAFVVPLQLVYARQDPMVPPRFGPELSRLTGAELVFIEEGSHFAHVDAVDELLPHLLRFWAQPAEARA